MIKYIYETFTKEFLIQEIGVLDNHESNIIINSNNIFNQHEIVFEYKEEFYKVLLFLDKNGNIGNSGYIDYEEMNCIKVELLPQRIMNWTPINATVQEEESESEKIALEMGNELEDANFHSIAHLPEEIHYILKDKLSESDMVEVFKQLNATFNNI